MPKIVAPGLTLWTPQECGLPALNVDTVPRGGKTEARLHYTTGEELGRPDFRAWWREIDRFHREKKGWRGVGYNLGVARDLHDPEAAHLLVGRGFFGVGAHTEGHNTAGLGIVFLGDDDAGVVDLTPGVLRGIRWCMDEGSRLHGNKLEPYPHSATSATACPGNEERAWIARGCPVRPHPDAAAKPATAPRRTAPHPVYPGHALVVLSKGHPQGVWQAQMRKRGWKIAVDRAYGPASAAVAEAFAREKGIPVTRREYRGRSYVVVNRALWNAAWEAPLT